MSDSADIFHRTRYIAGELSAAILSAGCHSIGVERARADGDFRNMEMNCAQMGTLLAQALQLQMTLAAQIAKETMPKVIDMHGARR